jgi:hypothetical protein
MSAEAFQKWEERILEGMPTPDDIWGFKTTRPERFVSDTVTFKRYRRPIFERMIDIAVFYEQVTGKMPKEVYVGMEEWREIMLQQRDVDYIGRSGSSLRGGMLGKFNGMAVFKKSSKHHLECV